MSNLPSVLDEAMLAEKLEDAIDLNGGKDSDMERAEHVKKRIIADKIADYISNVTVNLPEINSTELMYGSRHTGRQSQLYLNPEENVSKQKCREIARELDIFLNNAFPAKYMIGIKHPMGLGDDGKSYEEDEFVIFFLYRTRTHGSPSKPAGDSTEVLRKNFL